MRSTLSNLLRLCSTLSVLIIAGTLLLLSLGLRPFIVRSPSMEPSFSPGDLVFANVRTAPDDAQVGDVVIYRSASGNLVMHRLVDTNTLRGDSSELSQHVELSNANFVGVETLRLPGIGLLASQMKFLPWLPWTVVCVLLVLACVPWKQEESHRNSSPHLHELLAKLKRS